MSKKTAQVASEAKGAKSEAKNASKNVFLAKGAAQDALSGRVGARTHAIHVTLLDAARVGALLTTKQITESATLFMQRTEKGAKCNATASHLNTMQTREYLEREQGAWRLTDDALKLCGASWAQDVKSKKRK